MSRPLWLVVEPPSKKYEFVSWDDYSQYMESHKNNVPNHQPDKFIWKFPKLKIP